MSNMKYMGKMSKSLNKYYNANICDITMEAFFRFFQTMTPMQANTGALRWVQSLKLKTIGKIIKSFPPKNYNISIFKMTMQAT